MRIAADPKNNASMRQILDSSNITKAAIRAAHYENGKELVSTAIDQANEPKTGKVSIIRRGRGGRKLSIRRRHVASAKGESPAVITGNYRDSFGFAAVSWHQLDFGNEAEYAGYLEDPDILDRPGLGNAVKAREGDLFANYEGEIIGAFS